jgi:hypothetical protein
LPRGIYCVISDFCNEFQPALRMRLMDKHLQQIVTDALA